MWPRVVEFMLACWLAVSPFVFRHPADETMLWTIDWACALLVLMFALLSYWNPLRHIHIATAVLALAMIGYGRLSAPDHVTPALQNHIIVGLLLLMFAIVPNNASRAPRGWHRGTSAPL